MKTWRLVLYITDEGETPRKRFSEGIEEDVQVYIGKEDIEDLIIDPSLSGIRMEVIKCEEGEIIQNGNQRMFVISGTIKGDSDIAIKTQQPRS